VEASTAGLIADLEAGLEAAKSLAAEGGLVEASTAGLIADLEAGLEAAKSLAAAEAATANAPAAPSAGAPDTSNMPGGVDSAPINNSDTAKQSESSESLLETVEQTAETDAVDIIGELKAGNSIADIANKLLDQDGVKSIVKAIGDLAGKIGL
jgi:hypothetical protein